MSSKALADKDPEWNLLVQSIADYARGEETRLPSTLDWQRLVDLAERHCILPLLSTQLSKPSAGAQVPPAIAGLLVEGKRQNLSKALRVAVELGRLKENFQLAGIDTRVLKGLPLASVAYHNVVDRHVGDIDLFLMNASDLSSAHELLLQIGYRPCDTHMDYGPRLRPLFFALRKENVYTAGDDSHYLELHWSSSAVPVFPQALIASYRSGENRLDCLGVDCVVPGERELFRYLIWHGSRTQWFRLKWLVDVYLMACKTPDLAGILKTEAQSDASAQLTLGLLQELFPKEFADAPVRKNWLVNTSLAALRSETRLSALRRMIATMVLWRQLRWYKHVLCQYMIRLSDYRALSPPPWFVYSTVCVVRPLAVVFRRMSRTQH